MAEMDKYIGKRLDGRYEIKEIIGVGGMAYVYKAYDNIDDRVVAVKILKEEFLANEEFTRRFKNESKAIAILSHPNIVRVYDVSFGEKLQYIVMEYIDGITLKEYIDQKKVIPWKETVHFTVQVLRALQHAHDKGIIHRDIKPQNIMLTSDGTIKVTDFGIAQFSRNEIRTDGERAIGSVHYISPEQASGGITDEKADIYSLGVMLYEMLTGKLPFEADNAVSVAIMQMQSTPAMPREINESIPEGLEEITMKAMQKDPSKRYQSAAEMLYDIDEFKRNPSIHFEYKYVFVDETPTRFVETIAKVREKEKTVETEEEEAPRRRFPVLPILAAIAAALVIVALFSVGVMLIGNILSGDDDPDAGMITVPDLINQQFIDQETFLAEYPELASLNITVTRQWDDTYAENAIIATDPKPKKKLEPGETLSITVSRGAHMVQVLEITADEAADVYITRLQNAGFHVVRKTMASEEVEKGLVVRSEPSYPDSVAYGSAVTVFISSGSENVDPEMKQVPNVDQLSEEAARTALEEAGFVVGTVTVENHPEYPAGVVAKQEPAADTEAATGSIVNLVMASGYRDVELPLPLPETSSVISLEVFIDGKPQTRPEYSTELQNILPSAISTWYFTFDEQIASYKVTFRIKGEGTSTFQLYASYTVNALTGEWTQDVVYPFGTTTTTTTTTTAPTEDVTATTPFDTTPTTVDPAA
ncbi:MAG: Stk1 family PASTA domain-containing Ser/Thr kinase [Ruminococcaceae bacterium]|nr:Stk1 family PASTA domain-containing Ser/Thr kinase [Oscillospiraceae bacterium]